ncbi:retrovirus-related pol polyprotein from transposon TNT 1-94 [Tanacetum coccineum]
MTLSTSRDKALLSEASREKRCVRSEVEAFLADMPQSAVASWPTLFIPLVQPTIPSMKVPPMTIQIFDKVDYHIFLDTGMAQNVPNRGTIFDPIKKHIQAANDTLFKEVKEYEQIFDDLDAEYERCVLDNKNLTIEKKNLLIKNDCLIAECLEKDICSIVLTSDIVVPPSSNCLCEDLRSACDREHTKVLELEAEVLKQQKMVIESEKRSCDQQALETDRIQLKDTITSLRIQLDGLKVENVSLQRRYDELSRRNTHTLLRYTEKHSALILHNIQSCKPSDWQVPKGSLVVQIVLWTQAHLILSPVHFVDRRLEVAFRQHSCHIRNYDMVDLLKGSRTTNLYSISLNDMMSASPVCLLTKASSTKSWLWHRRLNHLNFGTLNELARNDLVRGLPMLKYDKDHLCPSCQLGKSKKASHPLKAENTNTEVLHTLHMDLCGPMRTESINGKKYVLVIVDDYTRFGWVRFLRTKDETPQEIEKFIVKTQRALNATVRFVRTDNGTEFVNKTLDGWFESVAPLFLWAEVVATACYTLNRSLVHTLHGKTYYELLKGKKPNLQYFRVFGSLCYPTNDYDDVGKLKAKADIVVSRSDSGLRTKRLLQMLTMQDVMTHGEVLLVLLNFLDIDLLVGLPKSKKVLPSPLQKLNTLPYQDAMLKSFGCVLNSETIELSVQQKFPMNVTIKCNRSICNSVATLAFPSTLIFVTTLSKSRLKINTAYPLPLDTAYRSSGTEAEIFDFRAKFFTFLRTNPTECLSLVSVVHDRSSTTKILYTPYKEPEQNFDHQETAQDSKFLKN